MRTTPFGSSLEVRYWEGRGMVFPFFLFALSIIIPLKIPYLWFKNTFDKKIIILSTDHLFWNSNPSWYLGLQVGKATVEGFNGIVPLLEIKVRL